MSGIADLIRRARELAALADNATPGPWKVRLEGRTWEQRRVIVGRAGCWTGLQGHRNAAANARLASAAWDMAALLREMADALEAEIGLAERMASELDRMHEELVRAQGRTCYECPDCGAVCVGR